MHKTKENAMTNTFTKTAAPDWLMAMWKEIDDKTFGKGFDCFADDAVCNLGVADWQGRETIRENLRAFIDTGFTAHHEVVEYWDGGSLKVFRGIITMTPDDKGQPVVKPIYGPLLLHGRVRSYKSEPLDRCSWPDRVLGCGTVTQPVKACHTREHEHTTARDWSGNAAALLAHSTEQKSA